LAGMSDTITFDCCGDQREMRSRSYKVDLSHCRLDKTPEKIEEINDYERLERYKTRRGSHSHQVGAPAARVPDEPGMLGRLQLAVSSEELILPNTPSVQCSSQPSTENLPGWQKLDGSSTETIGSWAIISSSRGRRSG
jgi:hypothetical protein